MAHVGITGTCSIKHSNRRVTLSYLYEQLLNGFPMTVGRSEVFSSIGSVYSSVVFYSACFTFSYICKDTSPGRPGRAAAQHLCPLQTLNVLATNISDLWFFKICQWKLNPLETWRIICPHLGELHLFVGFFVDLFLSLSLWGHVPSKLEAEAVRSIHSLK